MRLLWLEAVPPGLAQDEILDADIASFIRLGQHAFFFADGFGHEPLYHYWAAPFAPLIGDNILAIRLPSIVLGLLLIALTLRWAHREFGVIAAVAAGVGLAISWWPIIFSRLGIRPIMAPVLLLLMAWHWPRRPWWAGLWLGLAVYTYTGARVVYFIPLLLLALAAVRRGRLEAIVQARRALIVLGMTLLVSAPMLLTLWANPELQQRVDQLSGPLDALREGDFTPILQSTGRTLGIINFTGDPRATYGWPGRPLFDHATALLFYGGLLRALWRWRQGRYQFILIWLAVLLIPSAITPQAPSTVRLIGALPIIYLLPGLGLAWIWRRWFNIELPQTSRPQLLTYLAVLFLLTVFGLNLGRTLRDGFRRWPQAKAVRLIHYQPIFWAIAEHYEAHGQGALVVMDSFFEPIDHDSLRRSAGRELPVRWAQASPTVGGALVIPAGADNFLYIPEYAPPPAPLLSLAGINSPPLFQGNGFPAFTVFALPAALELPESAPVTFNGALRFMGAVREGGAAGELAPIYTYWQVLAPLPADLALFIHATDAAGNIVSQHDGLDSAPQHLQTGDYLIQRHVFSPEEASDSLQLHYLLGVYTRSDNGRWVHDGAASGPIPLQPTQIDR